MQTGEDEDDDEDDEEDEEDEDDEGDEDDRHHGERRMQTGARISLSDHCF